MATCKDCLFKCYTDDLDRVEETCNFFLDHNQYAEVVRCKDCRYKFTANGHDKKGCPLDGVGLMIDDDFCSYGERKDNGTV